MKNVITKISAFTVLFALMCTVSCFAAEEKVFSVSGKDAEVTVQGSWSSAENMTGYSETPVMKTDVSGGEITWKRMMMTPGKYSLYVYSVVSPDGCKNASLKYFSDLDTGGELFLDMTKGTGGWTEVCAYTVGEQGATVTISGSGGCLYASAVKFVKRPDEYDSLIVLTRQAGESTVLKTDNSRAFVNGLVSEIEDAVPEINGDTAFVPARFLTDSFGYEIAWNDETREITIVSGEDTFVFTEGSADYTLNGEEKQLDSAVYTKSGRTMLPLRAISEGFGKKVYWKDSGLIVISLNDADIIMESEKHTSNLTALFGLEL